MVKGIPVSLSGRKYGKIDLDRVGYFEDSVSGPFDRYQGPPRRVRDDIATGGQIRPGPALSLFEKKFGRLFTGEALSETLKAESRRRVLERQKNVGPRDFQPPAPAKQHSTPNDFFGCFSTPVEALDYAPPKTPNKKSSPSLPNCKIKPNPLGGPGYQDICFSPYPKHEPEPYDVKTSRVKEREGRFLTTNAPQPFFPPDPYKSTSTGPTYVAPRAPRSATIPPGRIYAPGPKSLGGCKAGCFDKFPKYESTPYETKKGPKVAEGRWIGGYPNLREKYTRSIIEYGTRISCNANNYPDYKERVYPLRF